MLILDVQRDSSEYSPGDDALLRAAQLALSAAELAREDEHELSLRIVDRDEMQNLNRCYRGKDAPTNVLSFPAEFPEGVAVPLLGDVVICAPVVGDEAREQGKVLAAHWDHLLIHGVLHLLGYDHQTDDDAHEMESRERTALAALGWPCPYESPVDESPDQPDTEVSAPAL